MALYTHDIPILEHDSDPGAVIAHDREPEIKLPRRAVFAFLGDLVDQYAEANGGKILSVFETVNRSTNVYEITHRGQQLLLCRAPLGGAAAVQFMDWLIGHGVDTVISTGCCGTLVALPENVFLLPAKALRDEGASYHYLAPTRFVETDPEIRNAIAQELSSQNISFSECTTWTTDGFFRETAAMVAYRRKEGCVTVEMECASLAACAKFRGVRFGQLLFTADTLADVNAYDERSWGLDARDTALRLCLDIAANMK